MHNVLSEKRSSYYQEDLLYSFLNFVFIESADLSIFSYSFHIQYDYLSERKINWTLCIINQINQF